jgi:Kef-type K+ transport system membrane component KefB/nucleotide-binding universal stress UspA family protein
MGGAGISVDTSGGFVTWVGSNGGVLPPLSGEELLFFFGQLFVLLVTARALGELARAFEFPSVLGELLAGIVLGPSILGNVAPSVFLTVFPAAPIQYHLLEAVSWLGLVMLLVITGFETDLDLIASRAGRAGAIASTSIVVPFVFGFAIAWVLPSAFLANGSRLVFSLFIATALSISAIPVIAKILLDLDVIDREISQLTIAAGMINDTVGWILLAVVAGLARQSGERAVETAGITTLFLLAFLALSFTVGRWFVSRSLRWVDATFDGDLALVTTVTILALGAGTLTHALGLEAVLGAFVVGILVGRVKRFDQAARHVFEVFTLGILAPIFFATAGLRVDVTTLSSLDTLLVAGAVLLVAIAGKFIGAFLGARGSGLSNWEGIAIGAGLNARGALEIIVATIGVSVGVLTGTTYTIIVVVAIVTSLLAPPVLRVALGHIEPSEAERRRSARREREARSFLGSISRVLLPTRCSRDAQFAAQLIGHIARNREMDVTTMYVTEGEDTASSASLVARARSTLLSATSRPRGNDADEIDAGAKSTAAEGCLSVMDRQLSLPSDRTGHRTVPIRGSASETVIEELRRGYDLLAVGANFGDDDSPASPRDDGPTPPLFETGIDRVLQRTTAPVLAVSANGIRDEGGSGRDQPLDPVPIRRILVPTVGTEYSRHAAEMAFAIATDSNALVEIVHVVDVGRLRELFVGDADLSESVRLGAEIVDREATLGRQLGASVLTDVLVSEHPTRAIVGKAAESGADLVVLGSGLRPLSRRAFLGHRAEYVLKNAPCPVAVVTSR